MNEVVEYLISLVICISIGHTIADVMWFFLGQRIIAWCERRGWFA